MEAKIRKKLKKEFSKILPKDEKISSAVHEMQSEIQKLKLELTRRPSEILLDNVIESSAENIFHGELYASSSNSLESIQIAGDSLKREQEEISAVSETEDLNSSGNATFVSIEDLSEDFHSMLEKSYFTDVDIKCGLEVLRAHKNVLCARSPIFEAMFTSPMQESEKDTVVIEDIEPITFHNMLTFIYCGKIKDLTVPLTCDLLYAAEKYQIKALKDICVQFLKSNLTVENALDILQCADLYDAQLRKDALCFISANFIAIKLTEEWDNLQRSNSALALEIYSDVVESLQKSKQ